MEEVLRGSISDTYILINSGYINERLCTICNETVESPSDVDLQSLIVQYFYNVKYSSRHLLSCLSCAGLWGFGRQSQQTPGGVGGQVLYLVFFHASLLGNDPPEELPGSALFQISHLDVLGFVFISSPLLLFVSALSCGTFLATSFVWMLKRCLSYAESICIAVLVWVSLVEIRSSTLAALKQCFIYLSMDERIWVRCWGMRQRCAQSTDLHIATHGEIQERMKKGKLEMRDKLFFWFAMTRGAHKTSGEINRGQRWQRIKVRVYLHATCQNSFYRQGRNSSWISSQTALQFLRAQEDFWLLFDTSVLLQFGRKGWTDLLSRAPFLHVFHLRDQQTSDEFFFF